MEMLSHKIYLMRQTLVKALTFHSVCFQTVWLPFAHPQEDINLSYLTSLTQFPFLGGELRHCLDV